MWSAEVMIEFKTVSCSFIFKYLFTVFIHASEIILVIWIGRESWLKWARDG